MTLSGKVEVLTGSSGGLGRAIALELARAGSAVVLHYFRNEAGMEALQREIAALGSPVAPVRAERAGDRPGRRHDRPGHGQVWADRYPRQQRRYQSRRDGLEDEPGRVGRRSPNESRRRVQLHESGSADDAKSDRRQDRQHRLRRSVDRCPRHLRVCGIQVGFAWLHTSGGLGGGSEEYHRQRARAWILRGRADRFRLGRDGAGRSQPDPPRQIRRSAAPGSAHRLPLLGSGRIYHRPDHQRQWWPLHLASGSRAA